MRLFFQKEGWKLYRADGLRDVARTDTLLWEGDAALDGSPCCMREREYLVLEFEDDAVADLVAAPFALPAAKGPEEVRLETCFRWLAEAEQLSETDAVYCSRCKEHRRVFKRTEFWSFPPLLMLQLKRFEFTGDQRRRLDTAVRFPLEGLDLTPFALSRQASFPKSKCLRAGATVVIYGLQSAAGQKLNGLRGVAVYMDTKTTRYCVRLKEGDPSADWKRVRSENLKPVPGSADDAEELETPPLYDLAAICKHIGNMAYGHYVAYTRSSGNGLWYLYDDEEVTEVSAQTVEGERVGVYVLFYLRRDFRPASWEAAAEPEAAAEAKRAPEVLPALPTRGGYP